MTTACRCSPARRRGCGMVRFRTLGCYPLTGAVQSDAADARRHHRRDARLDHLRAPGPADRHRRGRLDGEEEARGLFLMTMARRCRSSPDALARPLRFLTCGSVDDGKSTLIGRLLYEQKLHLRRPALGARARLAQARHDRRGHRFRAAGRRARGRARAGHHDRRRLSLLLDAAALASSSPTRPATSNTPATWRPAPRTPISPSCWSMRARAC